MANPYNLTWDATGERRYETGVDHGVLYTSKGTGTKAFTKASVWNGLTSVTETPSGAEANDIYADNIKYAVLRSAETLGGTIEAYMYPDEFCACNGEGTPDGLSGVYVGQQTRAPFGFCYRSDVGDDSDPSIDVDNNYKLHLWWNCTASPSERQYQTINDSPDAITFSWEISTTPIAVEGMKPTASMTIDTSKFANGSDMAAHFEVLLQVLYGTPAVAAVAGHGQQGDTDYVAPVEAQDAVPGYLPTPDEVIAILTNGVETA